MTTPGTTGCLTFSHESHLFTICTRLLLLGELILYTELSAVVSESQQLKTNFDWRLLPITDGALSEHFSEFFGSLFKQFSAGPIKDDAVAPNEI